VRSPILILCLVAVVGLGGLTIAVIARNGLDPLTVISLGVLGLLGTGLVGALNAPDDDDQR
jgi:hypothetical protein